MKNLLAKSLVAKVIGAVLVTVALAGCGTVTQESAMEWMERQSKSVGG